MSKPYDSTTKDLLEADPPAWLTLIGIDPPGPVRVVDSDLATVTASADKVLLVDGPTPFLVHYEFQASRDPSFLDRLLWYNVLLGYRHAMPVISVVILLRPSADTPDMTGRTSLTLPDGQAYLSFGYRVARIWQEPVDEVLAGPLGTLPLAPISAIAEEQLSETLFQLCTRLQQEPDKSRASQLLSAAKILAGLRYPTSLINEVFEGVLAMFHGLEESSVIQSWLAQGREEGMIEGKIEGKIEGIRSMLLNQGGTKFGPPELEILEELVGIDDFDRLLRLSVRLLAVRGWEELLAGPVDDV